VAGWALGINPFDQPNVQEAKDNTKKVLDEYEANGELPAVEDASDEALKELLAGAKPPHYVAIMGYLKPSSEFDSAVSRLRSAVREATKATTTFGYGPASPPQHRFSSTRAGLPQGCSSSSSTTATRTWRYRRRGTRSARSRTRRRRATSRRFRSHDLPAQRVRLEGDPAEAVERLTDKIKEML